MKKTPLWVFLVLLGFLTFYTYEIIIAPDMGWYMNSALNLYSGKGYRDIDGSLIISRGPLFPLMIVGSYRLLGVSPWSAFWVVRVFAILTPLSVYGLGKRLFDTRIGLSAALLVLTSYSMNYWSYRHLDGVWPFFAVLSILAVSTGLEKQKSLYFVLSGLLFGLGYLIKPALILLLPLPLVLLVIISEYRTRDHYRGVVLYLLAIALLILPWIWYAYGETTNVKMAVFGVGGERAADQAIGRNLLAYLKEYFLGLRAYYSGESQSLSENFILAPLFVFSWMYTVFRAFKKEKASILLSTVALLMSPYISYVGSENMRVGQLLFFLLFSYLVTARFCFRLCENIILRSRALTRFGGARVSFAGAILVILILIAVQTFAAHNGDRGNKEFLKKTFVYQRLVKGRRGKVIRGTFARASRECGEWMQKAIPAGSGLMAANSDGARALFFYSGGNYPVYQLPILNSRSLKNAAPCSNDCSPVFVSSWIARVEPRNKIFAVRKDDMFAAVSKKNIKYIIIHGRRNFLVKYFNKQNNFKLVKEFGRGAVKVFKVFSSDINNYSCNDKTLVTYRLIFYLERLRVLNDPKFYWYKTVFFKQYLCLDETFINKIADNRLARKSSAIEIVRAGAIY